MILEAAEVQQLFEEVTATEGSEIKVDLQQCQVVSPSGKHFAFQLAESARHKLLNGLDAIGLTLSHEQAIADYEAGLPGWRT